jgi:hypothetical protein
MANGNCESFGRGRRGEFELREEWFTAFTNAVVMVGTLLLLLLSKLEINQLLSLL